MFGRRCRSSLGRSSGLFGWKPDKSSRCKFRAGHSGAHVNQAGIEFTRGIGDHLPWKEGSFESDDFQDAEFRGLPRVVFED